MLLEKIYKSKKSYDKMLKKGLRKSLMSISIVLAALIILLNLVSAVSKTELRDVLKQTLKDYFENSSRLTIDETRDLLDFYLSLPSAAGDIDLSDNGSRSSKSIEDIVKPYGLIVATKSEDVESCIDCIRSCVNSTSKSVAECQKECESSKTCRETLPSFENIAGDMIKSECFKTCAANCFKIKTLTFKQQEICFVKCDTDCKTPETMQEEAETEEKEYTGVTILCCKKTFLFGSCLTKDEWTDCSTSASCREGSSEWSGTEIEECTFKSTEKICSGKQIYCEKSKILSTERSVTECSDEPSCDEFGETGDGFYKWNAKETIDCSYPC